MKERETVIYHVYTDGSCVSGEYGGYAVLFAETGEIYSARACLTNQQAELMAIELAFQQVDDNSTVIIYTDSAFAIGCVGRSFNLSESPWLKCIRDRIVDDHIIKRHIKGKFIKVKGHSEDKYNRLVDKVAQDEAYILKSEMN